LDPRHQLERKLALSLIESHPDDAAGALERLSVSDAAALLADVDADEAAGVLRRMVGRSAADLLCHLPAEHAAETTQALPLDAAASLLRRIDESTRVRILSEMDEQRAAALRSLLEYERGTAGAAMDPDELALPEDLTIGEAIERVMMSPHQVHYNLYIVDREHLLVGVLNLHELFVAPRGEHLSTVMLDPTHKLVATAGYDAIVAHPGWRSVPALPVVDGRGRFLGSLRYRTLRRIERQIEEGRRGRGNPTSQALADLYWTGIAGLVGSMLGAASPQNHHPNESRSDDGEPPTRPQ